MVILLISNRLVEEHFTKNPTINEALQRVNDEIKKEKRNEESFN
jgi:hypothetical protein